MKIFVKNYWTGSIEFSRSGKAEKGSWDTFAKHISYQSADIQDHAAFKKLGQKIEGLSKEWEQEPTVIFYLAVASEFFPVIAQNIKKNKLSGSVDHTRIVIEKPFGHDLESAKSLNALLCSLFDENQIYRIDHYLGKEAVQNIMAFRFANSILEPIWNRNYIQHVQISVSEQIGVGSRGQFYEGAGVLSRYDSESCIAITLSDSDGKSD